MKGSAKRVHRNISTWDLVEYLDMTKTFMKMDYDLDLWFERYFVFFF
jgi:hypothetical protein